MLVLSPDDPTSTTSADLGTMIDMVFLDFLDLQPGVALTWTAKRRTKEGLRGRKASRSQPIRRDVFAPDGPSQANEHPGRSMLPSRWPSVTKDC